MNPEGHLTVQEANAFCQPTGAHAILPPAEILAISDHLARCVVCHALVAAASAGKPGNARRRLLSEMQGLAQAANREIALEKEDMETFARSLEMFPEERFRPGDTLPASGLNLTTTRKAEQRNRPGAWPHRGWGTLFPWPVFVMAGTAAIAIAGLVVLTSLKPKSGPPSQTASAVPLLQDGPVLVAADGSLHANADFPDELRRAMLEVIARRALRVPGGMAMTMRGDTARSSIGTMTTPAVPPFPVLPVGGSTVETQRPLFQWTRVPTATDYQVEITAAATTETLLSPRLPFSRTNWQPETALVRGRIYHWRVLIDTSIAPTADRNADEMGPVSFKVLGEAGEEELQRLRTAPHRSHLALAITCARLDLPAEAREELGILCANDPHSALAVQLRNSLR